MENTAMKIRQGMQCCLFVIVLGQIAWSDLLSNGDFKANANAYVDSPGYSGEAGNPSTITNWDAFSFPGGQAKFGINGDDVSFAPVNQRGPSDHQGNTFPFIENTGVGTGLLQQTLPSMNTGSKYLMTFQAASRVGDASKGYVQVSDADTLFLRVNISPPNDQFRLYSRSFVSPNAFSGVPFIQLVNDKGNSTMNFAMVSVTAIPEPSSILIFSSLLSGFWLRRSRQNVRTV